MLEDAGKKGFVTLEREAANRTYIVKDFKRGDSGGGTKKPRWRNGRPAPRKATREDVAGREGKRRPPRKADALGKNASSDQNGSVRSSGFRSECCVESFPSIHERRNVFRTRSRCDSP